MKRIQQLSPMLANQIAAGEVVERPASVVKELIENSIDAKATKIEIDIEGGGLHLIRVRDDGTGIVKNDLHLAFSSHATSKINTVEDLAAIYSLGFRGEALASIASVSRCRLISMPFNQDQECAWQIQLDPDGVPALSPSAHPVGTCIEVADLFYNTPVRRKFLRSEKTEFQYIDDVVKRLALANPGVSFLLKHQDKQIRFYPKQNNKAAESARIAKICGQQFMEQSTKIALEASGLSLSGWVGLPTLAKRQADCQYFFVNGRMIKDRLINHVIKTVYQQHDAMIEGTYPAFVLYLTLDPHEIDVNVHPTKHEVRFHEARLVHDFLSKCIQESLSGVASERRRICPEISEPREGALLQRIRSQEHSPAVPIQQKSEPKLIAPELEPPSRRYHFIEQPDGVILVDLHQAKTSLLSYYFEQHWGNISTKPLLFPLSISLKKSVTSQASVMSSLSAFGFILRFESPKEVLLLRQSAILQEISKEFVVSLIELAAKKHDIQTLAWQIGKLSPLANLQSFSEPELTILIKAWTKQSKMGWVMINHETLANLMAQETLINSV